MTQELLFWGVALIAAAALLLVIEVFVPSGGIIAIVSAVVAIAGVVSLFRYDATWGMIGVLSVMVIAPLVLGFGLKVWPNTPIGRAMMHGPGGEEAEQRRVEQERLASAEADALIGAEGEALTDLHPSGTVRVDGTRHDALSDGAWIDRGATIVVVGRSLNDLRVRAKA
ncbi:MAG: NfeD family protein [Planctomycetota bacterium]